MMLVGAMQATSKDLWAIPVKHKAPAISMRGKLGEIKSRLLAGFQEYCNISTLHGLRNVADTTTPWYERLTWFVILVVFSGLTVSMTLSVWDRYLYMPTITTIETNHYPIYKIPFPSVTICNTNVVLHSSARTVINKLKTVGIEEEVAEHFLKLLPQAYKANRYVHFHNWKKISEAMQLFNYTLESLMFELSQPCARMLQQCIWRGDVYNCSDMFVPLATPEGFCCSFNWHGTSLIVDGGLQIRKRSNKLNATWRKRGDFTNKQYISDAGTTTSGLTVIVDTESGNYYSSINSFLGAAIMVHDPVKYPDISTTRVYVQPRNEMNLPIGVRVVESSSNVRELTMEQRQCRFEDEMDLQSSKAYSYESCILDCRMQAYLERCNCTPFFYPKYENLSGARQKCDLLHWPCLFTNRDIFANQDLGLNNRQHVCDCFPSCSEITYELVQVNGNYVGANEHASIDFGGDMGNKSLFNVFFRDNVCIKYRRSSQMSFEIILASFGGILGLYLGGSVLSVIELIYYLLVKIWERKDLTTANSPRSRIKFIYPYPQSTTKTVY